MDARPEVLIAAADPEGEPLAQWIRRRLGLEHPDLRLGPDLPAAEGGRDWWAQFTAALDVVEVLVLVLTPGAVASPHVPHVCRHARRRGVRIYPVWVRLAPAPDLRAMPRWMSRVHCYDLDIEWDRFILDLKGDGRAARVPWMAPDLPAGFVARPREFDQLWVLLLEAGPAEPRAIAAALVGAGGSGTTTLAAALCHDDDVIGAFDDGILWVTLGERPDLLDGLARLHRALTGQDPGCHDVEQAAQALAARLKGKRCLIVVDDVRDGAHLQPFLRGGQATCARLITAEHPPGTLGAGGPWVDVGAMTADESVRLLAARLDAPPPDLEPFRALARRLGERPLLLELVGAALREQVARGVSVPEALDLVSRRLDEGGGASAGPDEPRDRPAAIVPALGVGLDLLDPPERRRCLELAIFAAGVDIPLSALGALWGLDAPATGRLARRLGDLSLLKHDLPTGTVRLHDVVRTYLAGPLADAPAVHARLVDAWGDVHRLPPFAWRWLAYHLVEAGRRERLRALLLDFAWLQAKLEATDVNALLADFALLPDDADLRLVEGAIRRSARFLSRDKAQLRGQLYGRLLHCETSTVGQVLTRIVAAGPRPWLRPLTPCLAPPDGAPPRPSEGHAGGVFKVAELPDGQHALSASDDQTLKLWDLHSGRALRTLEGPAGGIAAVAALLDGRHALSASGDGTMRLWDLHDGQAVRTLASPAYGVRAIEVLPDGQHALSASDDGTLKLWDLDSGRILRTLVGHIGTVTAAAILPNGRQALSASSDGTLKLWDLDTGRVLDTLERHFGWVFSISVLPNGRHALCALADGTLKLWNLETGRALYTLKGHSGPVLSVAVLPDGYRALSASYDGTLRLWDLDNTVQRASFHGDAGFWSCAVAPDGRTLLGGDADGRVHFLRPEGA